jgi:hypothetical protein
VRTALQPCQRSGKSAANQQFSGLERVWSSGTPHARLQTCVPGFTPGQELPASKVFSCALPGVTSRNVEGTQSEARGTSCN